MAKKLAGLALARKIKKLVTKQKKLKGQKETPLRIENIKKIDQELKGLRATTKKGTERKAAETDIAKVQQQKKRKDMAYREDLKNLPPKDRKEVIALRKQQIKDALADKGGSTAGGKRAMSLTAEGEKLRDSGDPKDMQKLIDHIRKHGDRSKYVYESTGSRTAVLEAKGAPTGKEITEKVERGAMTPSEELEARRRRSAPLLTRQQTAEAMGINQRADPKDLASGFEVFNKGGLSRKRYQSTKKYGAKEHVYLGGGMVQDIMHFRKKRGR